MNKKILITVLAVCASATVASAQVFTASGPGGDIPDGSGTATSGTPFTSVASIAGSGTIVDVFVEFDALAHTWVGDVVMRLIHPNGSTTLDLMSRPGRGSASTFGFSSDFVAANSYVFSDSGANLFDVAPPAIIPGGTYRPSSNPNPPDTMALPYEYTPTSFATTFGGLEANGDWTLWITDWAAGDTGSIGGWTLNVVVPEPATLGALALGLALLLRRRRK